MKKKEVATALGLSVALTMTGCASQTDVDAMNSQITELTAQMESLQTELSEAQAESNATTSKNAELESQVAELQTQLESTESELEDAESVIKSADDDMEKMTINVTKYSYEGTAVYLNPAEVEEEKIAVMDLNDTAYVTTIFSDATDSETLWAGIGTLVTTDEAGNVSYQIIENIEKYAEGEEIPKLNNVAYFFKKAKTITVEGQTIKADELGENQEIRIVYARTSLLSNSKVTEQQKTSAEKSSTPKQSTSQQSAPADDGWSGLEGMTEIGTSNVTDNLGGINLQFH